jgi:hypothetical protein
MKEHTKNARPSTYDKHTDKQKAPVNNKKYTSGKMDKVKVQPNSPKNGAKKKGFLDTLFGL